MRMPKRKTKEDKKALEYDIEPGCMICNDRTLFINGSRTLAIADLHIGYEGALQEDGVAFPKFQLELIKKRLSKALKKRKPSEIIIVGDLKHELSRNMPQEWDEVLDFLHFLQGFECKIVVVKGNHDIFLGSMLSSRASLRNVSFVERYDVGKFAFVHGHNNEEISEGKMLIMGHEHPSIMLRDEVGATVKLHCFIVGKGVVVLPAFSPLASGADVNSSTFMSPMLEKVNEDGLRIIATSEIGLLDFRTLGALKRVFAF